MKPIENDPERLRHHITGTYLGLRLGIAVIGAFLPFAVWGGGRYLDPNGWSLLGSISTYYHTAIRDVFVGGLVATGVCLYLYKGFSRAENWALNAAGVFIACVALIPTQNKLITPIPPRTWLNDAHVIAAVLFFVCIGYVSIFRAPDTLRFVRDVKLARILQSVYRTLGIAMIVLPLSALVLAKLATAPGTQSTGIFWLEAVGVWVFSAFWAVKTGELAVTDAEQAAAEGKVEVAPPAHGRMAPGRLVQTAPLNDDLSIEFLSDGSAVASGSTIAQMV